ncbi:hypothetical protein PM082_013340 [Marasmius tenuissimus]|nr:hypothetical protein PM082_013340 [Marasmius tenuissimus]
MTRERDNTQMGLKAGLGREHSYEISKPIWQTMHGAVVHFRYLPFHTFEDEPGRMNDSYRALEADREDRPSSRVFEKCFPAPADPSDKHQRITSPRILVVMIDATPFKPGHSVRGAAWDVRCRKG